MWPNSPTQLHLLGGMKLGLVETINPQTLAHYQNTRNAYKIKLQGPSPRVSDSVELGQSLSICVSNKLPDDAENAGSKSTELGEPLIQIKATT